MRTKMTSRMIVVLAALCLVGMTSYAQEKPAQNAAELAMPTANENVANAVPYATVQDIADQRAEYHWGPSYCIAEIPCCDMNGDVVAYMFVYKHGQGSVKSDAEIRAEIRQGRQEYKQAEKELQIAQQIMDKKAMDASAVGSDPFTPVVLNPTPEFVRASVKKDAARKKMYGVGQYGYMIISATYDRNPIPVTGHGLPEFYTRGDLVKEKAQNKAGAKAQLKRIYMAGAAQRWYQFEGDKPVTINGNSLKEDGADTMADAMAYINERDAREDRRLLYAAKWQELESGLETK